MGAAFLLLVLSSPAAAEELGAGRLLVARRELRDANFVQTVVLLLQHGERGSWGVVINRPSKAPLSAVLKGLEEAKDRFDPAFLGGPVARTDAIALLRSPSKSEESQPVFGDVHRLLSRKGLQKALKEGAGTARLRLYLGYAGWGAGQLENEVKWGMWHTLPADVALVFDSDPETLWPRLIRKFEVRYAAKPSVPPWPQPSRRPLFGRENLERRPKIGTRL